VGLSSPPTATAGETSGNDPFTHPIQAVDPGKMLERRKTHRAAGMVRALSIVGQTLPTVITWNVRTASRVLHVPCSTHHRRGEPVTGSGPEKNAGQVSHPAAPSPHPTAEAVLGTATVRKRAVGAAEARAASRLWWDTDADDYQAEHGGFLGLSDFVWCPERLREAEAGLLGDVRGKRVLEVGCGAAACSRWLARRGAHVVGLDISAGMLRHAADGAERSGITVPLVQASADGMPFEDGAFDVACSAFGALAFVADSLAVMREVARVLRPDGRWVFAVTHPMRWIFPDDPGPTGLTAVHSYFDRTPYLEVDTTGRATYVEYHRTLGDYVRHLTAAGFRLVDLVEPDWPQDHTLVWGQWSPLRGRLFPGTAIFCCRLQRGGR
jgi:SAM-dependent methyltransferase